MDLKNGTIEGLKLSVKGSEISGLARKRISALKKKIGLKRLKEKIESSITNSMNCTMASYIDVRSVKALREQRINEIAKLEFIASHVEPKSIYRITMVDFSTLGIGA